MRAVRALQKRVARIERASMPRPSLFALVYSSFDQFVEQLILPGIEAGALASGDMIEVVAALCACGQDGTWERAIAASGCGADKLPSQG